MVPPAVLLGATEGIALLVRARTVGATYWCALAMTAMLAVCAFVLSLDALRALALTWAGFSAATARAHRRTNDASPTGAYGQ